jgi:P27 family predicted phage terminase small subunit
MGSRGPAPTPTALRILHGDRPGRINTHEPQMGIGNPKPPYWLRKESRRYFRELVRALEPGRLLTPADSYALGMLADAIARYVEARNAVEAIKVDGRDGGKVRDPALTAESHAAALVHRLMMQFGLTPASRTSLIAGVANDDTGAAALLS